MTKSVHVTRHIRKLKGHKREIGGNSINKEEEINSIIRDFEERNDLKLQRVKSGGIHIVYPSFGAITYSSRRYSKKKRMGELVDKMFQLRDKIKATGATAKFLNQEFLLKAGIVGGPFGVGYKL